MSPLSRAFRKKYFKVILTIVLIGFGISLIRDFYAARGGGARVLFVGDIMFDRTIRSIASEKGEDFIFACTKDFLKSFDAVVGNLEGPVTSFSSKSIGTVPGGAGNMTFTFPTTLPRILSRHNIQAVSIGNNHITDFGREGVSMTRSHLKEEGIEYFGDPFDANKKSAILHVNNAAIALVGYNQFLGVDSVDSTVREIKGLYGKADYIVVFAHWGDEYVEANAVQKASAHAFVDAGADAVFGAHPHVIQENETYRGKKIYYSLGNFIFDQYWNEEVRRGLGVEMIARGNQLSFREHLFDIGRDGRTCLVLE